LTLLLIEAVAHCDATLSQPVASIQPPKDKMQQSNTQTIPQISKQFLSLNSIRSAFDSSLQPLLQPTPQPIRQFSQATIHKNLFRIVPEDSRLLHNIGNWYVGLLEDLPPPQNVTEQWEKILEELVHQLTVTTATLDRRIPTEKTITEPVLCMAGKKCSKEDAEKFLDQGVCCPINPVLLKPTAWIRCGGFRCKKKVKHEIRADRPPLLEFLNAFSPQQLKLHISREAPRPASRTSSLRSLGTTASTNDMSFAVQYPLGRDTIWPATARFTVGSAEVFSTIGGRIYVNGKIYSLTTAHGIVTCLEQVAPEKTTGTVESSDDEPFTSDSDSDVASSDDEPFTPDSDSDVVSSLAYQELYNCSSNPEDQSHSIVHIDDAKVKENDSLQPEWQTLELPKIIAYLGRGTTVGDYTLNEAAPITSDFALVDLQSYGDELPPIANNICFKDALSTSEVEIAVTATNTILKGRLLKGRSFLVMRDAVMQTMKIQIDSPRRT
jgi:hypothetical protein